MSDRFWSFVNSLSYLYNAFAVFTDGELNDEERNKIRECVSEWCPDTPENEIDEALKITLNWFNEDLIEDVQNDVFDSGKVANNFFLITFNLRENLTEENCKAILNDLIRIGQADGNLDEREQTWAHFLGTAMGIVADTPNSQEN